MKLIINKNQLNASPEQFLRRAGYGYIRDRQSGSESYVYRLGRNFYPRLHMYVEAGAEKIIFNLHLDQKQPSYQGASMHNAEYGGEVVEKEIARLKQLMDNNKNIREPGNILKPAKAEGKSRWKKIFGI
ncbi:hypothetical protein CO115_00890 [Candidatus Falkowbacteria bacterium CG_4_9_14_3_um_filter_36_9]|uniref:Uncharacterized protein n=2 Tax=Candidatus Falkowiibacteriota TaxID=1752728 RepID=A0A1J4TAJ7_9BACT|nr:MAG: hypothetical protein AUJ27_02335 [Candidatus Falkowbacteria bacterium CG1_02_37_44]PIV51181.1 MAG: hypothetical protein COS18_03155 [Candidatus Falkowbacteria bacterium CG02_land_8_20_14_3_00_36_14]PIX11126.1 MAG: hypothetical protein COZ73_03495 [Candidatus Falkowbacteria bacterium CG_4_8_14_3_um_filter_36_11]PJA10670.1 MAG: hypothetical protein COX67_03815 [Candidatus Falkowbacteria bacterium CG_4_10_14_0_2_um_filter_36_22]PJB20663.1 MAG: hypothetical protein CO115_00890 [Candidatus F